MENVIVTKHIYPPNKKTAIYAISLSRNIVVIYYLPIYILILLLFFLITYCLQSVFNNNASSST